MAAATMAKKFAEADAMFPEFRINYHCSIYTMASHITQVQLGSYFYRIY